MKKHVARLHKAHSASLDAISVFEDTEKKLQAQNAEIEGIMTEIDADIRKLRELQSDALTRHASNTTVLGNLAKILRGNS